MKTFESGIIWCHCTVVKWHCLHAELRHILLCECNGQFLRTVVPEVKEYNHISFLQPADRISFIIYHHYRFHELVSDVFPVRLLHGFNNISDGCAFPVYNKIVGFLYPLPSLVPVHGIIPSNEGCDPSVGCLKMVHKVSHISGSAFRISVPAIAKAMYKDIAYTVILCHVAQIVQMPVKRMNPSIGQKSEKMDLPAFIPCI